MHSSEVLLQVVLEQEPAAALCAQVRPQARVDERVLAHVAVAAEGLAASAARVPAVGRWLPPGGLQTTWNHRQDWQLLQQACKERKR